MKKQQRAFVVETKSTRRRSKMQSKSIWGDMDFGMLAREEAATHLLADQRISAHLATDENFWPGLDQPIGLAITDNTEIKKPYQTAPATADQGAQVQVGKSSATLHSVGGAVKKSKPRGRRISRPHEVMHDCGSGDPSKRSHVQVLNDEEKSWSDDLALLDNENRRLKLLLADRMRQQNMQLRIMLKRFETV